MKLLTATRDTQGQHPGDFNYAVAGELVMQPPLICDADNLDPDSPGACGCGRSWVGLNSHQGTTTAVVREIDLTVSDYSEAVASALDAMGWGRAGARRTARDIARLAADYQPGTVLGHRLGEPFVRTEPDSGGRRWDADEQQDNTDQEGTWND